MSTETLNFTPHLYEYLLKVSLREPKILTELRAETAKLSTGRMQIAPEQGQFMALLIEILGAKKTLEVGTYTGYSALAVALALPENGKVIACDVNTEWTAIAQQFWQRAGVAQKIDLRIAPGLETIQTLITTGEAETFDFVFIDADKANYANYYELGLQLVRRGGLIAIDNVLWGGDVADASINNASTIAIRALNEKVFSDNRVSMSLLPIGDGLTLARKR